VFSSTASAAPLDFALLVHISQRPRYLLNIRSIRKNLHFIRILY